MTIDHPPSRSELASDAASAALDRAAEAAVAKVKLAEETARDKREAAAESQPWKINLSWGLFGAVVSGITCVVYITNVKDEAHAGACLEPRVNTLERHASTMDEVMRNLVKMSDETRGDVKELLRRGGK